MKKKASLSILTLLLSLLGFTQTNLQKAHNYFLENKTDSAKMFSEKACVDSDNPAEAYLMLSILATIEDSKNDAVDTFAEFTQHQSDINPYFSAFFHKEIVTFAGTRKSEKMVDFLVKLLASGRLNGTNTCCANEILGHHYLKSANLKKAKEYFAKIGTMDNWQITGTFENVSGGGFDKNFDPIQHPEPEAEFVNKHQAPVKWFKKIESYPGRWNYMQYHFAINNSIVYAQSFVSSPANQEVEFRIGTSGSLKVWLNDKLMFEEAAERNNGLDTYAFKANLKSGTNRILLQLGCSEISANNFLLRITDDSGKSLEGLESSANYTPYTKDTSNAVVQPIVCNAEKYFQDKVELEPENYLHYIMLASEYLAKDKNSEAQEVLFELEKSYPNFGYIYYLLYESYSRDENRTELSKSLERIKELSPDSPLAIILLISDASDQDDLDETTRLLKKLGAITGYTEYYYMIKIGLSLARKKYEDVYYELNDAYKAHPNNAYFVQLKYLMDINTSTSPSSALNILSKYLKNNYNAEIIFEYANYYFEQGKTKAAYKTLNKCLVFEPEKYGKYNMFGKSYFNNRQYSDAMKYYDKLLEFAPYTGYGNYKKAQCYMQLGNDEKAILEYKIALMYSPDLYDARSELRELEGKKPIFDLFDDSNLEKLCKQAVDEKYTQDYSSVVLLDESQYVLYKEGGEQERHNLVVKILNTDGIDTWKEYSVPVYSNQSYIIEKADVIKANGSKVSAEITESFIVFTGLEVGDAIIISHKAYTYKSGKFIREFDDTFLLEGYIPILKSKTSILAAKEIELKYITTNFDLEPEIKNIDDFAKYTWETQNLDAIDAEPMMANMLDCTPVVHVSTFDNWDYIAKWYADITKNKLKTDAILQEKVKELFEGKEKLSDLEKAKLIYNYITHEIRYSFLPFRQNSYVPKRASDVISSRIGDCKDVSTLFIALCREVGIAANYVLISSRSNGKNPSPLPSIIFDHCMAMASIDGQDYYVELTSDQMSFASLGVETRFAFVLVPDKNPDIVCEPFYLDPTTRVKNNITRKSFVSFEDNKISVECQTERSGVLAADFRDTYANQSKEDQYKMLRSIISDNYNNVEIITFDPGILAKETKNKIEYQYEYFADIDITKISDLEIFHIPLTNKIESTYVLSSDIRKYPMELYNSMMYSDVTSETVELIIPEGKQIAEIPADIDIENEFGSYKLTFALNENKLIISRKIQFYAETVSPEDYNAFKDFYTMIVKNDNQQLAFKGL